MPRLICISAANIRNNPEGTSFRVCQLAGEIATGYAPGIDYETIPLVNYNLLPCTGCGKCFRSKQCCQNDDFNHLHKLMNTADGLIVVSAHYAPIPSKLAILLEKAEQIAFLGRFHDDLCRSPLFGKPAAIIGHGGGTEGIMNGYKTVVLKTIANALMYPIDMDIICVGDDRDPGVIFPVAKVSKDPDSPFPVQQYDWPDIHRRITPIVQVLAERMQNQDGSQLA